MLTSLRLQHPTPPWVNTRIFLACTVSREKSPTLGPLGVRTTEPIWEQRPERMNGPFQTLFQKNLWLRVSRSTVSPSFDCVLGMSLPLRASISLICMVRELAPSSLDYVTFPKMHRIFYGFPAPAASQETDE